MKCVKCAAGAYNFRMPLTLDVCTAQHIGDRQDQQDRVAFLPHPRRPGMALAVLADGMGGRTGGAMAAEQVLHTAKSVFEAYGPADSVQEMLKVGIDDAHDAISLTRYTSEKEPHSTACMMLLQGGRADWAHCGDSRIYHYRDGALIGRSFDHSLVADLVSKGRLSEAEAECHPERNILLSCLGAPERPQIVFGGTAPLVAGDCFLLCSDGLWGYYSDAELGSLLVQHPPRAAAELLIGQARQRAKGHGDNISLLIVRLVKRKSDEIPSPLRG